MDLRLMGNRCLARPWPVTAPPSGSSFSSDSTLASDLPGLRKSVLPSLFLVRFYPFCSRPWQASVDCLLTILPLWFSQLCDIHSCHFLIVSLIRLLSFLRTSSDTLSPCFTLLPGMTPSQYYDVIDGRSGKFWVGELLGECLEVSRKKIQRLLLFSTYTQDSSLGVCKRLRASLTCISTFFSSLGSSYCSVPINSM